MNKIIKMLGENSGYSYEACSYLIKTYGHTLLTLIMIMTIANILDIAFWVGIIIITSIILRPFSGGAHSKSKINCTIISTMFPIGCGLYINNSILSSDLVIKISLIIFIIGLLILIKYAPADTPQKPIISPKFKKQLKRNALLFLTLTEIIIITVYGFNFEYFYQVSMSILFGLSWQIFTITPIGYRWFFIVDRMMTYNNN